MKISLYTHRLWADSCENFVACAARVDDPSVDRKWLYTETLRNYKQKTDVPRRRTSPGLPYLIILNRIEKQYKTEHPVFLVFYPIVNMQVWDSRIVK